MILRIVPAIAAMAVIVPAARVDADIVYFVSRTTGGLYNFNTAGGPVSPLSGAGPGTFSNPTALALGPDGNLYVGDNTGGGSINRYSMATGSAATVVALSGSNPSFGGGPVSPTALAFTPSGAMLVGRNPETQFSGYPAGDVLEVVGWNGGAPTVQNYTSGTGLAYQTGLTVAPDGTLFASNTVYNIFVEPAVLVGNVVKFNGSGVFQSVVATDGTGLGGLSGPTGLGVFGSSLFIASAMDGKVYKTDLTNPDTSTNTIPFTNSFGDYFGPLAMLSNGNLLVGSVSGPAGLIYEFDTTGVLVNSFGSGGGYGQIGGIVAVPEPGAIVLAFVGVACAGLGRLRRRRGA